MLKFVGTCAGASLEQPTQRSYRKGAILRFELPFRNATRSGLDMNLGGRVTRFVFSGGILPFGMTPPGLRPRCPC